MDQVDVGATVQPTAIDRTATHGGPAAGRANRRTERARRVVMAARRLVTKHGPDFTMQQLARESGVAIQTLYRHFDGKDRVILTVLEDRILESIADMLHDAAELSDPVDRLRRYISTMISGLDDQGGEGQLGRFIAAEHWRLVQIYPSEVARVDRPVVDLILHELRVAEARGALRMADVERSAWLSSQLLMAVYHFYTFAASEAPAEDIAAAVWSFCLQAWGGSSDGNAQSLR